MDLKEKWKRGSHLPGTIDDFVKFLGVKSQLELEAMDFTQLENLPSIKRKGLLSCGGNYIRAKNLYQWRWVTIKKGKYQKEDESYFGRGETYNDAALSALIVYWELLTYRKTQPPTSKRSTVKVEKR